MLVIILLGSCLLDNHTTSSISIWTDKTRSCYGPIIFSVLIFVTFLALNLIQPHTVTFVLRYIHNTGVFEDDFIFIIQILHVTLTFVPTSLHKFHISIDSYPAMKVHFLYLLWRFDKYFLPITVHKIPNLLQ